MVRGSICTLFLGVLIQFNSTFALETINSINEFIPQAIYDEDNRIEIFESNSIEMLTSQSVAGRFSKEHLVPMGSDFVVQRKTLGAEKCSSIRFAEQTLGPTCSGFLVAPDLLVTAGHCMNLDSKCSDNYWVFDFSLKKAQDQSYRNIRRSNVYSCSQIMARRYAQFGDVDYAIIKLDRPVLDRPTLVLDFETKPSSIASFYIVGFPSGLPMKVANQGRFQPRPSESEFAFDTDLDVFHGNSGSPVLDSNTGKVIGITSKGNDDYVKPGGGGCKVPKVCHPGDKCYPSTASRITNIQDDLNKVKPSNSKIQ